MDMMTQFMCQHGLDLIGGKLVDQCIPQHDTARVADARQRRVGSLRPLRHVELEHAFDFCVSAPRRVKQTVSKFPVLITERNIFIEQGHMRIGARFESRTVKINMPIAAQSHHRSPGDAQGEIKQFEQDQAQGVRRSPTL